MRRTRRTPPPLPSSHFVRDGCGTLLIMCRLRQHTRRHTTSTRRRVQLPPIPSRCTAIRDQRPAPSFGHAPHSHPRQRAGACSAGRSVARWTGKGRSQRRLRPDALDEAEKEANSRSSSGRNEGFPLLRRFWSLAMASSTQRRTRQVDLKGDTRVFWI